MGALNKMIYETHSSKDKEDTCNGKEGKDLYFGYLGKVIALQF